MKKILSIGFEKIVINTAAFNTPNLISEIAAYSGTQSVIGSIDIKKNFFGRYHIYSHDGTKKELANPVDWALKLQELGVGELLITSMDREGTWKGYDVNITQSIADAVTIPVIANGGAGNISHIEDILQKGHASAAALGSMVVYQKKGMGVLVNFPDKKELDKLI